MKYLKGAKINGRQVSFPIYLPDATLGVVRGLQATDLKIVGVEALVVNTYHLMIRPGAAILRDFGGIKKYMNWDGLIVSDSGGFQLLSMIYRNKLLGKINQSGVVFSQNSNPQGEKLVFTPEKSIQVQFAIGADIMVCLDDCPPVNISSEENDLTVERTIEWAKRSKEEYLRRLESEKRDDFNRPLLIAVIQGGFDRRARERCAKELTKIGFDGFGLGGWLIDKNGEMDLEMIKFITGLMPEESIKFGLGVGDPWSIVECFKMGYHIFDCVLPTRDARHGRLYVFSEDPGKADILNKKEIHQYLYIDRGKHASENKPISEFCDCPTCQNYSRAYLYHLFKINESLAWRLATIHNLRTYTKLIELLRKYQDF